MKAEIKLQAECWQWAWNTLTETRGLLFHVPNGGLRSKVEAAQLKATGVLAGIPDLLFIWKGKVYPFELKAENGRLNAKQEAMHKVWALHSAPVTIIRTLEDFQGHILLILLKP